MQIYLCVRYVYLFHILAIRTNNHQLENLKRIQKKIEKSTINQITGFHCKDMK